MKKTKQIIIGLIILFGIGLILQNNLLLADENSRHLIAVAKGTNRVFLGWRLFSTDLEGVGFDVYRSTSESGTYTKINSSAITDSTNYEDTVPSAGTYYYKVKRAGSSTYSNIAKVTAVSGVVNAPAKYQWLTFSLNMIQPWGFGPALGDLDGDGLLEFVAEDKNHVGQDCLPDYGPPYGNCGLNDDESEDGDGEIDFPDNTMLLRAYKNDGSALWEFDTGYYFRQWYINGLWRDETTTCSINVPFVVWDLDNDGKAEVVTRTDNGPGERPQGDEVIHQTYLTIINGDGTPAGQAEIPLPTNELLQANDNLHNGGCGGEGRSWVYIAHYMSIAYLDGPSRPPYIIVQEGVYDGETIIAYAVERREGVLTPVEKWRFESTDDDGPDATSGSGSHLIAIYDMDGDGKDEVLDGSTLLDDDGTVMWTAHSSNGTRLRHPDVVVPGDILPDNPGPEVWFGTEPNPMGVFLVNGSDGKTIWEQTGSWQSYDDGWVANLIDDTELPGYELYGKKGDYANTLPWARIFPADADPDNNGVGEEIYNDEEDDDGVTDLKQETYHSVIQWDDDEQAEVYYYNGAAEQQQKVIRNARLQNGELVFDNGPYLGIFPGLYGLVADVIGDWREEFIFIGGTGSPVKIYTNTDEIHTRRYSRWENLEYRKTAARVGGGYWRYYGPIDFSQVSPNLELTLFGDTQAPQGGALGIRVKVKNNSSEEQTFDIWFDVEREQPQRTRQDPVEPIDNITLEGGSTYKQDLRIPIPPNTPTGTYTLIGFVGPDYLDRDNFEDSDEHRFKVTAR